MEFRALEMATSGATNMFAHTKYFLVVFLKCFRRNKKYLGELLIIYKPEQAAQSTLI